MSSCEAIAEDPEKCRECGKDLADALKEKMQKYGIRQSRALIVVKTHEKGNNFLCDCCKEQFDKTAGKDDTEVADLTSVVIKEEENLSPEDIHVVATQNFFKKDNVGFSQEKSKRNECVKEFTYCPELLEPPPKRLRSTSKEILYQQEDSDDATLDPRIARNCYGAGKIVLKNTLKQLSEVNQVLFIADFVHFSRMFVKENNKKKL